MQDPDKCSKHLVQILKFTCHLQEEFVGVADRMAQLDPQAELSIQMVCPICATAFATLLDMAQFLAAEIANRSRLLNREIHTLALYYHWSEAEIGRAHV